MKTITVFVTVATLVLLALISESSTQDATFFEDEFDDSEFYEQETRNDVVEVQQRFWGSIIKMVAPAAARWVAKKIFKRRSPEIVGGALCTAPGQSRIWRKRRQANHIEADYTEEFGDGTGTASNAFNETAEGAGDDTNRAFLGARVQACKSNAFCFKSGKVCCPNTASRTGFACKSLKFRLKAHGNGILIIPIVNTRGSRMDGGFGSDSFGSDSFSSSNFGSDTFGDDDFIG